MDHLSDLNIQVFQEEDGSYYAEVKNLPGCFSAGETLPELEKNLQEAVESYILSLQKDLQEQQIHISKENFTHATV